MNEYINHHPKSNKRNLLFHDWQKRSGKFNRELGAFLSKDLNAKIIELGCSTGQVIAWLHSLGFSNASGIDIDKSAIKQGLKSGVKNIEQCDLLFFLQNYQHADVDLFILRDVAEHFSKDQLENVMSLMIQKLKIGGKIFIKTLNAQSPVANFMLHGDWTHQILFTKDSLAQLANMSGQLIVRTIIGDPIKRFSKREILLKIVFLIYRATYKKFMGLLIGESGKDMIFEPNLICVFEKVK